MSFIPKQTADVNVNCLFTLAKLTCNLSPALLTWKIKLSLG